MSLSWETALIVFPLSVSVFMFLAPKWARAAGGLTAAAIPFLAAGLIGRLYERGPWRHSLGGWGAPLGIDLHVDGLSALMVAMTALVGSVTTLYSLAYFKQKGEKTAGVSREMFWPLWTLLWGSLHVLFFSADAFNLYVALELVTLSGVALIALAGSAVALTAAMRYLLVSLFGSLCYMLGVAFLYGQFGTVDLRILGEAAGGGAALWAAMALMSTGLLMKTALFPLHFWLPPAHASAPAPVSAILSALVVKASFYLLLRLWFEVFPAGVTASHFLGVLGGAAILWGSIQALRAERLKLLVAYSTVAQLGYIFLLFPLTAAGGFTAWGGGVLFALAHACAKAAMFMSAGTILHAAGHDRVADIGTLDSSLNLSLAAFAVAGVNMVGLPPSGGFVAKWMLLNAALYAGEWWWVLIIYAGTLLAAAYVFRALAPAFRPRIPVPLAHPPCALLQWTALSLALAALALGFVADYPVDLVAIGAPFSGPALLDARP